MLEDDVFDFDTMSKVLTYIERGVTDVSSFLNYKLQEIENAQRASFTSGQRGVQIFMSDWIDAPVRVGEGKWPLFEASFFLKDPPYSGAVWHQEYKWSWNSFKYLCRTYWAPENFVFPTSHKVSEEEQLEKIIGVLGVNTEFFPYGQLPCTPSKMGFHSRNAFLALVYCQEYKLEWEETIMSHCGWNMRWNLDLNTVWFPC